MVKNKSGKILSVYWFAILVIVAGGVFGMVYVFYGSPYDVREIEAEILMNNVADCISYAGKLNERLISEGEFSEDFKKNILRECHFNFKTEGEDEEQYYIELNFYNVEQLTNLLFTINASNNKWKSQCAIQESKEEKKLAKCREKRFYSLDNANNQYVVDVLAVISKGKENVKI